MRSNGHVPDMSTVAEIAAALPKLTTSELVQIERALHDLYRQRGGGIVYDDTYGTVTEADLTASADEAFQAYDQAEAEDAKRQPRWGLAGGPWDGRQSSSSRNS